MPSPPSTRPSVARERRSSAFAREGRSDSVGHDRTRPFLGWAKANVRFGSNRKTRSEHNESVFGAIATKGTIVWRVLRRAPQAPVGGPRVDSQIFTCAR